MQVRDITTPRLRHSVAEAGDGRPLLLLHGFTGSKEDFTDFVDRLAEQDRHVVAPDHRGHGASDKPGDEADYSMAIMAADTLALADSLGWDRFDLLGHSMGGMIAQLMVLDQPQRVGSLVLMDTAPGSVDGFEPDLLDLILEVVRTEGMAKLVELAQTHDPRPKAPSQARFEAERPDHVTFHEQRWRDTSPAMYAAILTEIFDVPDRCPALSGLDISTLVVVGEEDEPFLDPSHRLADALRGRIEVIPDAAHSPQFENPDRWWKAVSEFLVTS